jgi:ketosteroid isomerase-like protein
MTHSHRTDFFAVDRVDPDDRWLDAWNQDDIDSVLAIVTDDFVLSSLTARLTGMRVESAQAIRDYIGDIRDGLSHLIFEQTGAPMYDLLRLLKGSWAELQD